MKKKFSTLFIILIGLISVLPAYAQTQLFKQFHFEDDGYILVGINSKEVDKNALADSLGDFYTDDVSVLTEIKKAWVFRRTSPQYACGYHYEIVILKEGKELANHGINLNCHEITTKSGSLYFDQRLLSKFKDRLKKLYRKTDNFSSISEARKFWYKAQADKQFVYAYAPQWLDFEGQFRFRFNCPEPNAFSEGRSERCVARITTEIQNAYPGEKVKVRANGGTSAGDVFTEVFSNFTLFQKFKLYKIDGGLRGSSGWEPFSLYLDSYWKSKPE